MNRRRSGANSVITYNGAMAEESAAKAELFNKYFCSVFRPSSTDVNNTSYEPLTDLEISHIQVSVDEVGEYLNDLDTSKACGPDGFPPRLLKECCGQIAPSICAIFKRSLDSGKITLLQHGFLKNRSYIT